MSAVTSDMLTKAKASPECKKWLKAIKLELLHMKKGVTMTWKQSTRNALLPYQVQRPSTLKVKRPIAVRIDNVGGFYMEQTNSQQTKIMDVCHNFFHKYIEDGKVNLIFVKSEDNVANIFINDLDKKHIGGLPSSSWPTQSICQKKHLQVE